MSFQKPRALISLGCVVSALGFARVATAQATEVVTVTVDGTADGAPLESIWPLFGFDEINYATSPQGRSLLGSLAAANATPVHIRNHFLFNTGDGTPGLKWGSTNVYTEDSAGNPVYDWALTDGIMDAITGAGALPFVELGLMPQALSTHPNPYPNSSSMLLDGGSVYPPTDYAKWADLIRTWATHADHRYPNVTATWLWELWNEPDIPYWNGTFDEYAKLYDYTESALHDVLPNAALGGPAVAGAAGAFLRQFLEHCAAGPNALTGASGTRLDLVTFHAKGGVVIDQDHAQMNLGNQLRLHRAGFRTVSTFPALKKTPIYITEADPDGCAACPLSSTPANAYRNSPAYGAYEVSMMKHSVELESAVGVKLGGVLTWAFTFPGTPYFAGYRALTTNDLNLPVLGAFELLGRLSGTRLPLQSTGARALDEVLMNSVRDQPEIDAMAARDGDTVRVLVWNYHDDLVAVPAAAVHLVVNVPASMGPRVRVSHQRVDESHGDAYTVWVAQGMPTNPSASQVQALQRAMDPEPLLPDETIVPSNGVIDLRFDLPRFGVSLVTLRPSNDSDGDGAPSPNQRNGCACRLSAPTPSRSSAFLVVIAMTGLGVWRRRR